MGLDEPQDLLVHYWVGIQDKQRLESTGPTVGVARGPGGGYGWGAGYGGGVTTYEYKEGTLVLDLIEPPKKQLVWRATIVGTLQDSPTDNVDLANKAIAKASEVSAACESPVSFLNQGGTTMTKSATLTAALIALLLCGPGRSFGR